MPRAQPCMVAAPLSRAPTAQPAEPGHAGPILRWAGSKRKQLIHLTQLWNTEFSRYVEPFAGSACLFFELRPPAAILGDTNDELMRFYRVVRAEPETLYARLCKLPRNAETYNRWRRKDPRSLNNLTRALRFLYLNRNCFNGIYRTNLAGQFNVPFGTYTGIYPSREQFMDSASLLRRAKLVSADFRKTVRLLKRGDFVYLDPPFAVRSRRIFRQYGKKSFAMEDMVSLAKAMDSMDKRGVNFVVSYADCREARHLARRWHAARLIVRRNIAGFADSRRNAYELLITNMDLPVSLRRPRRPR